MSESLSDQIARRLRPSSASVAVTMPRDNFRDPRAMFVPSSTIEAQMRLDECLRTIKTISCQISNPAYGPQNSHEREAWEAKAAKAKYAHECEVERMQSYLRAAAPSDDLKVAQDMAHALASEVERLKRALSEVQVLSDPNHAAFVEVAAIVLSETTFSKLMTRARSLVRTRAAK